MQTIATLKLMEATYTAAMEVGKTIVTMEARKAMKVMSVMEIVIVMAVVQARKAMERQRHFLYLYVCVKSPPLSISNILKMKNPNIYI